MPSCWDSRRKCCDERVELLLRDRLAADLGDRLVAAAAATGEQHEADGREHAVVSSSRQLMKVVLIVNPYASAVSEARVRAVERELGRVAQVRTLLTERPGHGTELASAADGDALVVLSGDGGFNEVLNGAPRRRFRSASCPAAARTCSRARSACRATRLPRPGRSAKRWRPGGRGRSPSGA